MAVRRFIYFVHSFRSSLSPDFIEVDLLALTAQCHLRSQTLRASRESLQDMTTGISSMPAPNEPSLTLDNAEDILTWR